MSRARLTPLIVTTLLVQGCAALNYPEAPAPELPPATSLLEKEAVPTDAPTAPGAPFLVEIGDTPDAEAIAAATPPIPNAEVTDERPRSWATLTREARIHRQLGEWDQARERLAQAALQVADRPGSNAGRRTIHGMRARLALDLDTLGRKEEAEALAETLFEEATTHPRIGGSATVELALHYDDLRSQAAERAGTTYARIPTLLVAFDAASNARASATRLTLAYDLSQEAQMAGDNDLARKAIDRAIGDAEIVAPTDLVQLGSLQIYKARIAGDQNDLATGEAAATAANQLFHEADADGNNRAVAEATLAHLVARRGDLERAQAVGAGALARLDSDSSIVPHAERTVLAEVARVQRIVGDTAEARRLFRRALARPPIDFPPDEALVASIREELAALEAAPSVDGAP